MKRNKLVYGMIAATALFAASCTDFDDYNEAYTDNNPQGGDISIWDNISSRENLSQFAEILKKGGYDGELQKSHFYTVWAPENGTYNYDSLMQVDKDALVKRFIKSHIANYNYAMSGDMDGVNVHTLNDKSFGLEGSGTAYTYDGKQIVERNIPNNNGILHTLNGYAVFLPNHYENIFEMTEYPIDSIRKIFQKYHTEEIDREHSVEGAIDEDGNQTYEDLVMIESNLLTQRNYLDADIANEDSNYTMLIPTDEAYIKSYEQIKKFYNYAPTVQSWNVVDKSIQNLEKEDVDAGLADSLVIRSILTNAVFDNNFEYNRWIEDEKWHLYGDTLATTRYNALSNGAEILNDYLAGPVLNMSNGYARVVDSLAYLPWETYNPELKVSLFSSTYRPLTVDLRANKMHTGTVPVRYKDGIVRNVSYLDFIPAQEQSFSRAYFYVPNVRSTTYNIYVSVIPAGLVDSTNVTDEDGNIATVPYKRSYKMRVSLNYADKNGIAPAKYDAFNFVSGDIVTDAEATEPDTVYVGQVTFPVSYAGLSNSYPLLEIRSTRVAFDWTGEWAKVDNRLRINAIILRPVEYDEYLKKDE